jgi:hypothetical protein
MKIVKYILVGLFAIVFATACNEGIDPISQVDPGPDASAPAIIIKYPAEGTKIQVPELITSINIQIEATDDIELKSVALLIDNVQIASFTEFKDYRRLVKEYLFDKVTNGPHTLTVRATDIEGKVTNTSVNFEKKPPYVPIYPGEIFYMPFDGDYMEKINFVNATKVGNPGFAGQALKGTNAYAGATDGYLTFPTTTLKNPEFSASFWLKINAVPDRAGILVMGPPDLAAPTAPNNRKNGFRFFRENAAGKQRFKLNVGNGTADSWFDGGAAADVDPAKAGWTHFAFTISPTNCVVYINGKVASQGVFTGVNWTDCDVLSIMSGAPRFSGWNHLSDLSYMDELRLFNKALTATDIQNIIQNDSPYVAKYSGEVFYMPFEGNYKELNSNTEADKVGAPAFADGKSGKAYAGATDSYITFPTTNLVKTKEVSAVFWMKVNPSPDRAGILTLGPEDKTNAGYPAVQNKRTNGFRFFREGSATSQQFKVNVGLGGTNESWNDGGKIDPAVGWTHFAFTVSETKSVIYINGELARESTFTGGIDWTGCDLLSIMSGAPRFTEWNHKSDLSLMDELRIFSKSLTQTEVQAIYNAEK